MTEKTILELLKANKQQRRFRVQTGFVVKRTDGFYIRYYRDVDGGSRTKVTERLCDLGTRPDLIRLKQQSFMSGVNLNHREALQSPTEAPPITIGGFWSATYLPWVEANKRFSTARGYKYVWSIYVGPELENKPLTTYRTVDACKLLDKLAAKLNRNSLSHVKSLLNGIFKRACREGIIDNNPMREAKESVNVRKPKPRVKYTLKEIAAILNALTEPDAKLFFALCAVLAMRPEEAAAVRWENINIDEGLLKVREAAPYGVLGELKTERSKRDLHFGDDVRGFVKAWHQVMGSPKTGLLFTINGSDPINHNNFAKYRIKPHALKVCERWNGCYSGRHGAATALYNQDGDVRAAYQSLGNSLEVVMKTYIEPDTEAGKIGLEKMQAALSKELNNHKGEKQ
jgi:integrase